MTAEERETMLHAYIDGDLSDAEARAFEEMLARDGDLRREERDLRTLVESAGALPESLVPGRDLWPDLLVQLERGEAWHRKDAERTPRFYTQASFWAAAVLLVIAGSALSGLAVMNVGPSMPLALVFSVIGNDNLSNEQVLAEFNNREAEFIGISSELRMVVAEHSRSLSPELRTVVDDNLAIIDSAILEMRKELLNDPSNETLKQQLLAMYERQINLLRQARNLEPAS